MAIILPKNKLERRKHGRFYIFYRRIKRANQLWDWDSWLTNVAVRQIMKDNNDFNLEFVACEKGCILNFLEHTLDDGRMPINISPNETLPQFEDGVKVNIHKPFVEEAKELALKTIRLLGQD